jgi:hypothetical protein
MVRYYYDGINTLLERQRYWNDFYDEWRWRTLRVYTLAQAAIGQIVAGDRTMTVWHPQTGAPTAWAQGGTPDAWTDRWYHYDMLGNVTGELDASGLVQSHVWMEAFGTVLSGGQTGRRLTTKTYDPDAGLYYFSARWYSKILARFVERNSPYDLCSNNPVSPTQGVCADDSETRLDPVTGRSSTACVVQAFMNAYIEMRQANWKQSDKYFHCKANCEAMKCPGVGKRTISKIIGETREAVDMYCKGNSAEARNADREANEWGLIACEKTDCKKHCSRYRPENLPAQY